MPALRTLLAAWDAADPSRRRLQIGLASVVVLGAALVLVAPALHSSIARAETELARARSVLAIARERVADNESLARDLPPPRAGTLRSAVDRVLARHALQATPVDERAAEDRFAVVIAHGRFDRLASALDVLARDEGVQVTEATLTALVEPGAVRAEMTFGR